MKRKIITRAIAFLLLGAIANVAMAWCIALTFDGRSPRVFTLGPEQSERSWHRFASISWPPLDLRDSYGSWFEGNRHHYGNRYTDVLWLHVNDANGDWLLYVIAAGWPCISLHGGKLSGNDNSVHLNGLMDTVELLPLYPKWPGFAINTLFYAGILWMMFVAPFALRRRGRIKRGLCPACAYPVGDSAVCTECGRSVQPRRGAGV